VYYQASKTLLTAEVSAGAGQQSVRLGAQGALVWIDGKVFASRRVQDSFALVEVPGYANVGVGFQGSDHTRTDADGFALLPRLQPYQRNSIRLNPSELPINAELDTIEQIAVPASRSAVKVTFPVRSGRAALIKIVLDDQHIAPAGAEVELLGDSKEFFVARRGEAFITGLKARNTLRLTHAGGACTVQVDMPATHNPDEIVRLGPLVCKGVQP
jgi:outer membrane usher protein